MRKTYLIAVLLLLFSVPLASRAQHYHETERAIEFPDVPGYHTLKTDLHIHTVFSDGSVWPDIRVQEALRDGLDAIALTDHLEYQPHKSDIPHPNRNRSYQIARKAAKDNGLIVINGSEITRSMPPGHSNAVFLDDANPLLQEDPMEAFRAAKRQGAFIFWNHPMWTAQVKSGIPTLTDMHSDLLRKGMLHGIEVVNTHNYSGEALQIALDHDLAIVGTSDIHGLIDWEYDVPRGGHRPVTLVFATERSKQGLKEALVEGRTAVWFNNMLIGRQEYVVPLIKASLSVEEAAYQEDSSVLDVFFENTSDVEYVLENQSDYPFHARADIVRLKPHETTRLQVKTRERTSSIDLAFEVLSAVVAPDEHPVVSLQVTVE